MDNFPKKPLIELVAQACQLPISEINSNVVQRMAKKFGFHVDLAIRINDYGMLADVYNDALKLPSIKTIEELEEKNGFILDSELLVGNEYLQICFKGSVPFVLKICSTLEYARALNFESMLKKQSSSSRFIIPFELYSRNLKHYMFMPLHPVTLEHLVSLDSNTAPLFWVCLSDALDFLHGNGLAHNDVKPANILINASGEFILSDLGSLVPFDNHSASTRAYLPRELWDKMNKRGPVASIRVDYWTLAMIIYEKVCRRNIIEAEAPKQDTIVDAINAEPNCERLRPMLLKRLVD